MDRHDQPIGKELADQGDANGRGFAAPLIVEALGLNDRVAQERGVMAAEGIRIYNKPHKSRAREAAFCTDLVSELRAVRMPQDYPLPISSIRRPVNREALVSWLKADRCLPAVRRQRCIDALQDLPMELVVALDPARISVDIAILVGSEEYFIEFHEEQHAKLTVDRPRSVFDASGRQYRVPRFVQRLVRDVLRVQNLRNYAVVWHDWYEDNGIEAFEPLARGYREYALPGTVSFSRFCREERR